MNMADERQHSIIMGNCDIADDALISAFCVVGFGAGDPGVRRHQLGLVTHIGSRVLLGPFVTIYSGARLHSEVKIDPYVRIGRNTDVGARTSVLYGARVHDDVQIGEDCVIAGNVSNRVKIGCRVKHHGRLAHRYNSPHGGWANTDDPSMVIEDDAVIGANSLLIGDITVGHNAYIAAGEIVRRDVPPYSMYYQGRSIPADEWRGTVAESGFWSHQ